MIKSFQDEEIEITLSMLNFVSKEGDDDGEEFDENENDDAMKVQGK